MEYYVYAYLRHDNDTPYYIGKGKGYRAFHHHCFVSVPKDKSRIKFYQTGLNEETALYFEQAYIKLFGRKDIGTGVLLNSTDGGEGVSGLIHSEVSKAKMRKPKSDKAKAHMSKAARKRITKPHSEETKRKIGIANKNRKLGSPSQQTKEKRSQTIKLWWANRKAQIENIKTI
ncbi:MAG: hypothetical protein ACXV2C_03900 [Candidatus Bathyarchaeia archaeon]